MLVGIEQAHLEAECQLILSHFCTDDTEHSPRKTENPYFKVLQVLCIDRCASLAFMYNRRESTVFPQDNAWPLLKRRNTLSIAPTVAVTRFVVTLGSAFRFQMSRTATDGNPERF